MLRINHILEKYFHVLLEAKSNLEKTGFNKNVKRDLGTFNIDSHEDFHIRGGNLRKYTSEISKYNLHNVLSPNRKINSSSMPKILNTTNNVIPQRNQKKKQHFCRRLKLI